MQKSTTYGIFGVAIYYLVTTALVLYALTCTGLFCGFVILLPVMPWVFLLQSLFSSTIITYFVATILNATITFFIGKYVGTIISRREL